MSNRVHVEEGIMGELRMGKKNARTGAEIARALKFKMKREERYVQFIISSLACEGLPIGACHSGFFIIETDEEFQDCVRELESRIKEIRRHINGLKKGWKNR